MTDFARGQNVSKRSLTCVHPKCRLVTRMGDIPIAWGIRAHMVPKRVRSKMELLQQVQNRQVRNIQGEEVEDLARSFYAAKAITRKTDKRPLQLEILRFTILQPVLKKFKKS